MSWTDRPTLAPGEYPRGEQLEAILDQIDSLTDPGWTSYTPVVTGSVAPPINHTATGRYRRAVDADLIIVEFDITFSGAGGGTGFYIVSLPVTANASSALRGFGSGLDSGTIERPLVTKKQTTSSVYLISDSGTVTSTTPWTWTTNDTINITVVYEPA